MYELHAPRMGWILDNDTNVRVFLLTRQLYQHLPPDTAPTYAAVVDLFVTRRDVAGLRGVFIGMCRDLVSRQRATKVLLRISSIMSPPDSADISRRSLPSLTNVSKNTEDLISSGSTRESNISMRKPVLIRPLSTIQGRMRLSHKCFPTKK